MSEFRDCKTPIMIHRHSSTLDELLSDPSEVINNFNTDIADAIGDDVVDYATAYVPAMIEYIIQLEQQQAELRDQVEHCVLFDYGPMPFKPIKTYHMQARITSVTDHTAPPLPEDDNDE